MPTMPRSVRRPGSVSRAPGPSKSTSFTARYYVPSTSRVHETVDRVMIGAEGGRDMTVLEQLAAYTTAESFDKLPAKTVRAARLAILDTLGVTVAGSPEGTSVRGRALIAHRRGVEEATVIGTPLRTCV